MKIMVSVLSALVIFMGIIPFLGKFPIPGTGMGYSIAITITAVLIIAMAFLNQLLIALERFVLVVQGVLLVAIAVLPFIPTLPLPTEGPIYAGMIILIGFLGLVYGLMGMG